MQMKMFSIYDSKTEAFSRPFVCHTPSEAVRTFSDAVNQGDSPYNRHPADYTLFAIGLWDDASGTLDSCPHVNLGNAVAMLRDIEPMPLFPKEATQ